MFTFVANPPNLANRGVHSYVNVAGSRLAGTVPDLPFATVAGVSGECLPIYVLEGIYGRMVVLDPSLHGVAFGTVNLRPSVFHAVETALATTAFDLRGISRGRLGSRIPPARRTSSRPAVRRGSRLRRVHLYVTPTILATAVFVSYGEQGHMAV